MYYLSGSVHFALTLHKAIYKCSPMTGQIVSQGNIMQWRCYTPCTCPTAEEQHNFLANVAKSSVLEGDGVFAISPTA